MTQKSQASQINLHVDRGQLDRNKDRRANDAHSYIESIEW